MTVGIYAKAISASVATGLTAAVTALDDGTITGYEWTTIVVATLVAAGAVWAVPNTPATVRRYGKAITAGIVAALGAVGAALVDGGTIGQAEWLTIAIALLGGLGLTYTVPNAEWSDGLPPAPIGPRDEPTLPSGDAPGPFQ